MTILTDNEWLELFERTRELLDSSQLQEIQLNKSGRVYHGQEPVINIIPFPAKSRRDIIRRLEALKNFRGYKFLNSNAGRYDYAGWFYPDKNRIYDDTMDHLY